MARALFDMALHDIGKGGAVQHPVGIGFKTRVVGQFLLAHMLAETAELAVVADGDNHMTVQGLERLIRRHVGVPGAGAHRRRSAGEIILRLVGQPAHLRVQKRHIDMLAVAGLFPVVEGGQDADGRIHAGGQIRHREANPLRPGAGIAIGDAGDAHQPGHALDQIIVAGLRCARPGLAEPGDRTIDNARIDRSQIIVAEPLIGEIANLEVFDKHVRGCGQITDDLAALIGGDIQGQRLLAPVGRQVIGGFFGLVAVRIL